MKTVIATIKPHHLWNIRRGKKHYEIRKTSPKELPFRVLLCESGSCGQIKAEFVCDFVAKVEVLENGCIRNWNFFSLETACISYDEMSDYIGEGKTGFAWHISEMIDYCSTKGCRVRNVMDYGINRPPQSWQYVKEEENHV